MKRFLIASAITAIATAAIPAHAQLGLGGSIVLDPTQAAHAVTQIAQGENIIQNGVQLLQTAVQAFELEQLMASAPGGDFGAWISPSTLWILLEGAANTYGNSQPVMTSANTGVGADAAYQLASVPRTAMVPGYATLSVMGQQQVAAIGATTDVSDAVVQSSLTTIGTMRSNEIQREADLENLEAESQTLDPLQQTDLATMQRINQALLLEVREGQEANQLAQAITQHQLVMAKQQQDAIKAAQQDASTYFANYQTLVAPSYAGGDLALTF